MSGDGSVDVVVDERIVRSAMKWHTMLTAVNKVIKASREFVIQHLWKEVVRANDFY